MPHCLSHQLGCCQGIPRLIPQEPLRPNMAAYTQIDPQDIVNFGASMETYMNNDSLIPLKLALLFTRISQLVGHIMGIVWVFQ